MKYPTKQVKTTMVRPPVKARITEAETSKDPTWLPAKPSLRPKTNYNKDDYEDHETSTSNKVAPRISVGILADSLSIDTDEASGMCSFFEGGILTIIRPEIVAGSTDIDGLSEPEDARASGGGTKRSREQRGMYT